MRRTLTIVLAIAAVAFPASTSASSSVAASLTLVQRSPLQVKGAHFKRRERVVVTATTQGQQTSTTVRATKRGRFLAVLGQFGVGSCLPLTITAKGAKGDSAKLVIAPPPGTEIPCHV